LGWFFADRSRQPGTSCNLAMAAIPRAGTMEKRAQTPHETTKSHFPKASPERRWQEGCRNAAELARELARRGVEVRPRVVRDWAMKRRRASADALDPTAGSGAPRWRPPSVNRTTRLLQAEPSTLTGEDQRFVERLRADAPALSRAVALAGRLANLLRRQSAERLDEWLDEAEMTPLARFAAGLRRDVEAVQGTIQMHWSTSPVEGQIGRLKMLKRTMYEL
jgi:transposase